MCQISSAAFPPLAGLPLYVIRRAAYRFVAPKSAQSLPAPHTYYAAHENYWLGRLAFSAAR
jgi:hypothetical protein